MVLLGTGVERRIALGVDGIVGSEGKSSGAGMGRGSPLTPPEPVALLTEAHAALEPESKLAEPVT
jgi:hypothetical protein